MIGLYDPTKYIDVIDVILAKLYNLGSGNTYRSGTPDPCMSSRAN
jgi:hypothetical protein